MHKSIVTLSDMSGRTGRRILGLMSGTSMDGLDMALCRVRGAGAATQVEVEQYASPGFSKESRREFREVAFRPDADIGKILKLNSALTREWIDLVNRQLEIWGCPPNEVDLIASHGQTVLHQPSTATAESATIQLVDGDHLAAGTGIITISDFRQKHIAAGYEGAPVAPLAEMLLFSDPQESRVLLNIGGIANFTFIPQGNDIGGDTPFATDTGPGNTLIDEAAKHLLPGRNFDPEGTFARQGRVDESLLSRLLENPFFRRSFPKSTGQETFNWAWVQKEIYNREPDMEIYDLMATLTELTARTVSEAIRSVLEKENGVLYVSGGGTRNLYLMERLVRNLPGLPVRHLSQLGVDADAKEAVLFAVLANETVAGNGWTSKEGERFTLGKISTP